MISVRARRRRGTLSTRHAPPLAVRADPWHTCTHANRHTRALMRKARPQWHSDTQEAQQHILPRPVSARPHKGRRRRRTAVRGTQERQARTPHTHTHTQRPPIRRQLTRSSFRSGVSEKAAPLAMWLPACTSRAASSVLLWSSKEKGDEKTPCKVQREREKRKTPGGDATRMIDRRRGCVCVSVCVWVGEPAHSRHLQSPSLASLRPPPPFPPLLLSPLGPRRACAPHLLCSRSSASITSSCVGRR